MSNNNEKRAHAVQSHKDNIYNSWLENAHVHPENTNHILCFDLSDNFARQSLIKMCQDKVPSETIENVKKCLAKPHNRVQAMFSTEELFLDIARQFDPDFQLKPDHFCVIYFGYNGFSIFWFPTPLASDGQHRRS
jgi:hypothetical protein